MTTASPKRVVTEGERQFIASLNSMVSCDTPILMQLDVVSGLAAHLTQNTGATHKDATKMAHYINSLSEASGYGLTSVPSAGLSIDGGGSAELLLYRKECCESNDEYRLTVDALLDQLGVTEEE